MKTRNSMNVFVRICSPLTGNMVCRLVILITVMLFTSACQSVTRGNSLQQLRVVNSGSEDIKGLVILFPGPTANAEAARIEFGDVPAGKTTDYRNIASGVYRYSAYTYTLGSRVINQAVMDWVGESPMKGAKFTYRLELDSKKEPGNQMQLIEVMVDVP